MNWKTVNLVLGVGAVITVIFWYQHHSAEDERRDKYIQCWNAYADQCKAADVFFVNFGSAKSEGEKRLQLQRCREACVRIDPYQPAGVDPRLANAIREVKRVYLELIDYADIHPSLRPEDTKGSDQLLDSLIAAKENAESVANTIASEVGGVHHNRLSP